MRQSIKKPVVYTNTTLWLMALNALSFDYIRWKVRDTNNSSYDNSIPNVLEEAFCRPKLYNSKPTDLCYIPSSLLAQDITNDSDINDSSFWNWVPGVPYGLEEVVSNEGAVESFFDSIVILNHNLCRWLDGASVSGVPASVQIGSNLNAGSPSFGSNSLDINCPDTITTDTESIQAFRDGFSLAHLSNMNFTGKTGFDIRLNLSGWDYSLRETEMFPFFHIGSAFCAKRFTFPRAADLDMTISYEYDGIDSVTGIGGGSFTKKSSTGRPAWGALNQFEVLTYLNHNNTGGRYPFAGYVNARIATTGRRTFKFKFSYLEDKDTFATWNAFYPPSNATNNSNPSEPYSQSLTNANNETLSPSYYLQNIDDGSLYTNFINRTLGGSLPFLFCLDEDEHKNHGHNPDNWAMVKLDKSSFSAKKVANDWYDVSFTFVECW